MESLNISTTVPKSDGRLKTLLWPTIRHDGDLEHIAEQGFWMCFSVAMLRLVIYTITGDFFDALLEGIFFFLCAIGVRERSLAASVVAFSAFLGSSVLAQRLTGNGFGVLTIVILALLLSNVRGIWLATRWTSENILPPVARLNDTVFDKLSGRIPEILWPKLKWVFVVFSCIELTLLFFALLSRHPHKH